MKSKKTSTGSQVHIGDISDVSGSVQIAGGDITIQQSIPKELAQALTDAVVQTKKRPRTARVQKTNIEKEVKGIQTELEKEKVDKGFLAERFGNMAKMAPDIVDVIITGIGNPPAGIALAVKKIAQKAKAEAEKKSARA